MRDGLCTTARSTPVALRAGTAVHVLLCATSPSVRFERVFNVDEGVSVQGTLRRIVLVKLPSGRFLSWFVTTS